MKPLISILLCILISGCSSATNKSIKYRSVFSDLNFLQPVLVTHAGDGSNRLFVVEQNGSVQVFKNDPSTTQSHLFLEAEKHFEFVLATGGEKGLLGLAFDPDFANNGFVYVNYTADHPLRTIVSQLKTNDSRSQVLAGTETVLLEIDQDYSNHNGGMIAFGPDGYLYVGMGDGGSGGDPNHRAQSGDSLLGKILRVDRQGNAPEDNPFVNERSIRDEIWALGIRNPWRFSFDRKTDELWLADVGQDSWEEINKIEKGGNYGWRWYEGRHEFNAGDKPNGTTLIEPVFEYDRDDGKSVTGGYVYRGAQFPSLQGMYFFGDFVSGKMWALNSVDYSVSKLPSRNNPSSFGEDEHGELYVLTFGGDLFQITAKQPK